MVGFCPHAFGPWPIQFTHSPIEIDKSRSTGKKPPLGGSLFSNSSSGSTPSELQPLVPLQVSVSKATMTSGSSTSAANAEYEKMNNPSTPLPTPPVRAARLSQLLKTLANAESSVSEVVKSRLALIDGLEKLLDANRATLSKEQSMAAQLSERRLETETKKRDVEDGIMRGLSTDNSPATNHGDTGTDSEPVTRPEVEALTPPPVEAITPVGSPKQEPQDTQQQAMEGFTLPGIGQPEAPLPGTTLPDISATLNELQQSNPNPNGFSTKKRKVDHGEEDYAKYASGDLDADVAELLEQEGHP